MNLKELRNKVKNITDYNPEVQTYLDDVDNIINDAYNEVYTDKRWTFAQKLVMQDIYPDVTHNGVRPTANLLDGRRQVIFSAPIPELLENAMEWEGQIFQYDGRDFTIDQVISGTEIRLREPFRGPTAALDLTWNIAHRFYNLPEDCIEVLDLAHTDAPMHKTGGAAHRPLWGKKISVVPRRDYELDLRRDYTADFSEAYILTPPIDIPAAWQWKDPTVINTADTNGAPLPNNWNIEFAWAFLYEGVIGPLSDPQTVKTLAASGGTTPRITLNLATWDDRDVEAAGYNAIHDVYKTPLEGMKKVLFYNSNFNHTTGERKGLPCWKQVRQAGLVKNRDDWKPLTCVDTATTFIVQHAQQIWMGSPRYREIDGQYLRFRPYPRPQGFEKEYEDAAANNSMAALHHRKFRQYELRYLQKPLPLCEVTDSPEMPYEFHNLIVYKALGNIFVKSGNLQMASMYEMKIDKSMLELQKRYLDRTDVSWQRGQFGMNGGGMRYDYNSLRKLN
tara:strand:+ start:496 stop:2007 length:1512 start_codon:yes stop_codon:yes gene_type:complete